MACFHPVASIALGYIIGYIDFRVGPPEILFEVLVCHTRFSEGNQVHTYMHAMIKFHAYSDIKVNTETVSRMKKKDYERFTLNPGNEGSKHHRQSTGGCVRLAPIFIAASSFCATMFIARVSTCRTQQVWGKE
jgi:hypothetical protein